MKKRIAPVLLFCLALVCACGDSKPRPSFNRVAGIKFTEVRREYDTGSMISRNGFQQKPEWVLYFMKRDSVKIWSPFERRFIEYPIYHDHDSVFNFSRQWFRMKLVSADSVILQLLKVEESREISQEMSNVYMKFYSEPYLRNVLKADPEQLKLPRHFDSLYVRLKSDTANRFPDKLEYAFAATSPVKLASGYANITVKRLPPPSSVLDDPNPADYYLRPEFAIRIKKAFKKFYYSFVATVDDRGKIHVIKSLQAAEDAAGRLRNIEAIKDAYLEKFLAIRPGTTLGIPHTSKIVIHVEGQP